jgi:hypothetical protein
MVTSPSVAVAVQRLWDLRGLDDNARVDPAGCSLTLVLRRLQQVILGEPGAYCHDGTRLR